MTMTKCPQGHTIEFEIPETPTCEDCQLIATSYSGGSDGVYDEWTPIEQHRRACEDLQDQMDAAFDHQYFDEW